MFLLLTGASSSALAGCGGLSGKDLDDCMGGQMEMIQRYQMQERERASNVKVFIEGKNGFRLTVTEQDLADANGGDLCALTKKAGRFSTYYESAALHSEVTCALVTWKQPGRKPEVVRHGLTVWYADGPGKREINRQIFRCGTNEKDGKGLCSPQ